MSRERVAPRKADPTPLPPVRWLWGSAAASPVLRLDDAGREAAKRHAAEGNHGRDVVDMPRSLPDWHLAALEQRDKRWAREVPTWIEYTGERPTPANWMATARATAAEHREILKALAER